MNSKISRFVVAAALAALVVVGGSTAVLAQSPNFSDFSSTTNLTLNGAATVPVEANFIRLTPTLTQQAGSVWFNFKQPVTNGFSTTFKFRISNDQTANPSPADGIALVIQNDTVISESAPFGGTGALAGTGGAIGFSGGCTFFPFNCEPGTTGIPNSLAVEFDTFNNGSLDNGSANHVAVQSCMNLPNTIDETSSCSLGQNYSLPITLADGNPHTVTITYVPPPTGLGAGRLDVILDNTDLFPAVTGGEFAHPAGVSFDLTTLGLDNGTAWVGFTGATGDAVENNDILSWTFTPQAQSAAVGTDTPAVLNFNGGAFNGNTGYDYNAILTAGPSALTSAVVQVQPILIDEESCEKLVDANPTFGHAQCFVFQNADGHGTRSAVLFELTCPGLSRDSCDQGNFFADLGTDFVFQKADNQGFQLLNSTIGPYAGWLKGDGGVLGHPCAVDPNNPNPLFHSNQISSFKVIGDPTGITKGGARPGGSCWVATYATGGEAPPGIKITLPKQLATYSKNQLVKASYTCSTPVTSKDPGNPSNSVGPYLTVASCTQSQAPNNNTTASCTNPTFSGGISCTNGVVDTSVKGLHVFQVKAKDSGGNVNVNFVFYNVK
jgi:hypothetical protein